MEHLRYSASADNKIVAESQLFSYWMIFLVLFAVLIILAYLFPGKSLVTTLLNQEYISEVDLHYSLLLTERKNNITYSEIHENPALVIQKINQQRLAFKDSGEIDNLWFNYIILRVISYNPMVNKDIKQQATNGMLGFFETFKTLPKTEPQLEQLAKDALAIGQSSWALYFYEQLIVANPNRSVDFYANTGKVALWSKQCIKSANYYFIAQHKTQALIDKRYFYFQALKILFQCDQTSLAIQLADKNIDGLSSDIQTYEMLIDLAIKGNQPATAQKYLIKLLQLKHHAVN
jgi:hypothetical protein